MAQVSQNKISNLLQLCDTGATAKIKGQALEDLMCYYFSRVPGISVNARDHVDFAVSQEIDIALWNEKIHHFPSIILVECKNWASRVGSSEMRNFEGKLRESCVPLGFFVAINGITGNPADLSSAHNVIAGALRDGIRILVFNRDDIINATTQATIVKTIQRKLCELAVHRTSFI